MKLKKKVKNIIILILAILGLILVLSGFLYQKGLSKVSNNNTNRDYVVVSGTTATEIAKGLENEKLIRNAFIFRIYLKLENKGNFKAGTYHLSPNMNVKEIVNILEGGKTKNGINITFREGLNIKQYGKVIESNTNHSKEEWQELMKDTTYIKKLMEDYWFLKDDILNKDIYYPLEGYLYPDTYEIDSSASELDILVRKMLDKMDKTLTTYKSEIKNSTFSVHEFLTLASIVELEGASDESRSGVAGVFINRLEDRWSLGSDVTACYAFNVDLKDCNDNVPYTKYNPYNTRSKEMAGRLPIGPICNASIASIEGTIKYDKSNYYYFVADSKKKVYFTKTMKEHEKVIREIKERGEWPW